METKSIFKSKIFVLNAVVALLAILDIITPDLLNVFELTLSTQHKIMALIALFVGVLNIFLRTITNSAVTFKSNDDLNLKQ